MHLPVASRQFNINMVRDSVSANESRRGPEGRIIVEIITRWLLVQDHIALQPAGIGLILQRLRHLGIAATRVRVTKIAFECTRGPRWSYSSS